MRLQDRISLRLLTTGMWLLGALPLWAIQRFAAALAWLSARLDHRESRVARINIALCFPDLEAARQQRMHRDCLRHTASAVLECGRIWTRPPGRSLAWIREVHGLELLREARAAGRGLIVAAPHLGNWELLCHFLASQAPLSIVYREPQWAPAEGLLLHGRGGGAVEQLPAQPGSVRRMLRALKDGRVLGILPDQQPKVGEGEFGPFFGRPALTMTLLSRLARRAGVPVLFGFAERLPGGAGFRVHLLPAPEGIDAEQPGTAVAALNLGVENCVRKVPEQYQWTYKRFSRPPPGLGNPYKPGHTVPQAASDSA